MVVLVYPTVVVVVDAVGRDLLRGRLGVRAGGKLWDSVPIRVLRRVLSSVSATVQFGRNIGDVWRVGRVLNVGRGSIVGRDVAIGEAQSVLDIRGVRSVGYVGYFRSVGYVGYFRSVRNL
jgi:hypothetical protein